ncbi:GntR family transcriptional regulator [Herbaspirillum sp. LeCh32-8]|uniref:GntR family transcriptional regulator n=1 Tax=Herbaspirillum sp. LeCh32-8 TaxID=2821356 RepID=UPI001AE7BA56|nr:GntR family transcriptional regulator [Herbaspirillum sp. LeCh32-8]MBP0598860.1 GntR family transcriptional regulator [Herbaspirillum sp. LeCh32-8]
METPVNGSSALSLPEMVYRELRNAILNGIFTPGQVLRQEEVAQRLGVSRSPLREALPRLEAEGMVVLQPRRGYAVATLDPKEIEEAFDLRRLLESELARHSISRRTPADIARVYAVLSEMANLTTKTSDADVAHWFELNKDFHNALLMPASRPHHMRALDNLRGIIEPYIRTEVRLTGDLHQAQQEHTLLAQAFVNGDADAFVELTCKHSEHTRDRLLRGLTENPAAE